MNQHICAIWIIVRTFRELMTPFIHLRIKADGFQAMSE